MSIFNILLFLSAGLIAYQDFKERLVSLWLMLVYFGNIAFDVWYRRSLVVLLENTINTVTYFVICFTTMFLYYYIREKKLPALIDNKIGKADIIILFSIGIGFPLVTLITFFSMVFTLSALMAVFVVKDKKAVPLAGMLVIAHIVFTTLTQLFKIQWN